MSPRLYPQSNLAVVLGLWRYLWSPNKFARLRTMPTTRKLNPKPWILNQFLEINSGKAKYMEIGVRKGKTFERVNARRKLGIDPDPQFNLDWLPRGARVFRGTSDEFFSEFTSSPSFDLIFIDGLHTFDQVARDILNSLEWINDAGVIVIDDCWPKNSGGADPRGKIPTPSPIDGKFTEPGWWGDVWKVLPWLLSGLQGHNFHLIGERGNAFCVLFGQFSNETKATLLRDISNFESYDPSDVFRGDFDECRIPTSDLNSVLRQYQESLAR